MDEAGVHAWFAARAVPRETLLLLDRFSALIRAEAEQQNLIAKSTLDRIWSRHIVDSAQLLDLAPPDGSWIDIGSGAGFPGLVIAIMDARPVTLVEPRALRAAFLRKCVDALGLAGRVTVLACRAEQVPQAGYHVVSARAVAALPALLTATHHLAAPDAVWLLPKGRSAAAELAQVHGSWQGDFSLAVSITDPDAAIVVARNIRRRRRA